MPFIAFSVQIKTHKHKNSWLNIFFQFNLNILLANLLQWQSDIESNALVLKTIIHPTFLRIFMTSSITHKNICFTIHPFIPVPLLSSCALSNFPTVGQIKKKSYLCFPFNLTWHHHLSLMGTGHQTHGGQKKTGQRFFFPCNKMILAHHDLWSNSSGEWGQDHLSPSSVLLNMRMALEILRAGPSLMLMIFTMSVWVSNKKASPSII